MQSKCGIVYAQGGGGTIREIFQDVEENYYAEDPELFTPMIFFDPDGYWERDAYSGSAGIDLDDILRRIFIRAHGDGANPYLNKVLFTTDLERIVEILQAQREAGKANLTLMIEGRAGSLRLASWNR